MTTTTTEQRTRVQGDTSKAKPAIASDLRMKQADMEDLTIAWVPVPLTAKDKSLLERVSVARGEVVTNTNPTHKNFGKAERQKVHAILSEIAMDALKAKRPALEEEAKAVAERIAAEETEETLQAKMAKLQKQLELAQQALAMKQKPAAKAPEQKQK